MDQPGANRVLLEVDDLRTHFFTERGVAKAVDGVGLRLDEGRILGIVGESGCGKSVTAHSILRLVPSPPGRIVGGAVRFNGKDLLALSEKEMQEVRGREISMIFQEPMTSLNPVFRVEDQIVEVLQRHMALSRRDSLDRTLELLKMVGIRSPEIHMKDYPHQMSGGMRQRVMIAMALACSPRLIIADEPTTALDVTIQAQILDLLRELREKTRTAILLITHDLGVIANLAEQVLVMYTGRVVEEAPVRALFEFPLHPYTRGLMRSIPGRAAGGEKRLEAIPGVVPNLLELPRGCKFNTRCPSAFDRCFEEEPGLLHPEGGHPVRCWLY
ncbi:ABC transporter ATP-binding protein [Syntrophobacter fumaroxidans]|uniref:Oligopeptide/dipeptide ABC transporter, ATPase subunit n=1 Tax=Syntrophobacter fumaroxidans (strain DSM 10017 / MPOB) TaxID=335543 RepID=A0LP63_SYNFM|nr:ABC transporter ATP-binding protein [Syntrophobacter fumaroxidans]ABK19215.1 oligopeptide/dipeptide ABC transporter, ATPase subunit [Syntrophobacter fumaroxidans MPOB]